MTKVPALQVVGKVDKHDLIELLDDICQYGSPRLFHDKDGWVCSIDMHVASVGASFSIRSDFCSKEKRYTQIEATLQCKKRIIDTLALYRHKSLK